MGSDTPLNAAQADLDAVEAIVRAAGTSFYRGMRVLPPDRRHAMYAIYAFCRMVDDIADEDGAFAAKLPELTAWRERVAGSVPRAVGRSGHPGAGGGRAALRACARRTSSPSSTACRWTPRPPSSRPTWRRSTSTATVSPRPWGACRCAPSAIRRRQPTRWPTHSAARSSSPISCATSQEDAERGRLYLPREWLDAAGVPHDPSAALHAPGLRAGLRARRHAGARALPARPRKPCGTATPRR